jgi:hypothetical protein
MTIARFERIIRNSGMRVDRISLFAVKGLPLVTRIPVVREFLTAAASCLLTRIDNQPGESHARHDIRTGAAPVLPSPERTISHSRSGPDRPASARILHG